MAPILVIDVETTGFDPACNACVELGAVLLSDALELQWEFSSLIAPWAGAQLVPEALAVSGISVADLQAAIGLEAVVARFDAAVKSASVIPILAGWNIWFDVAFLKSLYVRAAVRWPFGHRLIDVQSIFAFFSNLEPRSQSQAIRDVLGEVQSHRALDDAQHTARLLTWMNTRRSTLLLPSAVGTQS